MIEDKKDEKHLSDEDDEFNVSLGSYGRRNKTKNN